MRVNHKFIFIFLVVWACGCNSSNRTDKTTVPKDSAKIQQSNTTDTYSILTSHMTNSVVLDSFLDMITHQEKVKVLSKLKTIWDETNKFYVYYDSNYKFRLNLNRSAPSDMQKSNSIFVDGETKVSFKDYDITCYQDTVFYCENYGFNWENSLQEPKLIEVCGKRFLYANISYRCNGIGCGCFLTFIYDLETHKPTFIENYRIPYDGFFISDFNHDNKPDLLVISSTLAQEMRGFEFDEFELRLTAFSYNNGTFTPHFDNQYQRTYCYQLYGFTNVYHHSYHDNLVYSITKDNWFRQ